MVNDERSIVNGETHVPGREIFRFLFRTGGFFLDFDVSTSLV